MQIDVNLGLPSPIKPPEKKTSIYFMEPLEYKTLEECLEEVRKLREDRDYKLELRRQKIANKGKRKAKAKTETEVGEETEPEADTKEPKEKKPRKPRKKKDENTSQLT